MNSPVLYTNFFGRQKDELSHSQTNTYRECGKEWSFKYPGGWQQRWQTATAQFGHDIQESIRLHYIEGKNPAQEFRRLWESRKDDPMKYSDKVSFEKLLEQGVGLMEQFYQERGRFPVNKPVFLQYKDRRILKDERTGIKYASIPDFIAQDSKGFYVCDIKALASPVGDETPGQVILDRQLRTQAAVTKIYRVVLWVFSRSKPKQKKDGPEPKYRIQWLEGEMTPEHALEAVQDEMTVVPFIQAGHTPRRGGIRWPNDACLRCSYRGLCLTELYGDRATPEQSEAWDKITKEELKRYDEDALEGLD